MYSPDPTFVKDLKRLDERLGCHYASEHGRFVITYKRATGQPVPVLMVPEDRRPDRREILALQEGDLHRTGVRERLDKGSKYMQEYRDKRDRDARDNIRNMTKDDKRQLANTFARAANTSKANSTFRRIDLKPKGKVIE